MSAMDLEREVIRMGDVGVAIDMVDSNLADGKWSRLNVRCDSPGNLQSPQ